MNAWTFRFCFTLCMTVILAAASFAQGQAPKNGSRAANSRDRLNLTTQFVDPEQIAAEQIAVEAEQGNDAQELEDASQPEETPEESTTQPPSGEASRMTFLELERKARLQAPELFKNLTGLKAYKKRLPSGWRALNLTQRQTEEIYKLDEEYHKEIALLQARIDRLNKEREKRLRSVLKPSQLQLLNGDAEEEATTEEPK